MTANGDTHADEPTSDDRFLEPAHRGRGADVKALFARHDIDEQWSDDVEQSRQLLRIEERG